jgi:hypothetical protein
VPLGKGAPANRIAVNQGVYALSVQSTLPVVSELAQYVGSSPGNETGQGADPGFDEPGTQGSTALNGGGYVTVGSPLIQVFNPTTGQMAIRMTALSTQGVYFLQNYEVAAGASLTLALPAPPARPVTPRTPVGVSVSCSGPCVGVALMGIHGTAIGTAPVPTEVWDNPLQ